MTIALDRRSILRASAIAGGGLLLPACATLQRRTATVGCLPPVNVAASRVIRTVAGLRPYRDSGFVVRAEPLGDKRLVHNYGHGGAGITLSWGTSRLAVDLGLPSHSGPVAVIGAGIVGLTTARLVQEAGFPVILYAAALPPDTTSNLSGGQFHPFGHFRSTAVTPAWRAQFTRAVDYSWRRFQIMVGEEYGVRWLPTYTGGSTPETQVIPTFPPINRVLSRAEHPFPRDNIVLYETMYVETGLFMRSLLRDLRLDGGDVRVRRFATRQDIAELPERLVFNCTGLGARELFGDTELQPIRGQLAILLPQPEVRYAFSLREGYMFPRPDGILLGGTFERGVEVAEPQPADIDRILADHKALFDGFRCTA